MIIRLTKNYRLHPFRNGEGRGWSKLRCWFDFFFPYAQNGGVHYIRAEASATDLFGPVRIRDYYTFRAFAWDFLYEFVINPVRHFKKNAVDFAIKVGVEPRLAYKVGAIAFDNAAYTVDAGSTPQSASYTCTGTNRYLALHGLADTTATFTSYSYAGVNATQIGIKKKSGGNTYTIGIYGQGNPASGSNTATLTTSTGIVRASASSYSGAQQTDAADSVATGETASGTGLSVSTTVVAANSWLIGLFFNNSIGTKTAGSNTTKRAAFVQDVGGTSQGAVSDSNADQAAGSRSQAFDDGIAAQNWVGVVMSIAPSGGAPATAAKLLALLGVG